MKASLFVISALFGLLHALAAQGESPFVSPAEQKAVSEQDAEFNRALTPSLSAAAASTVRVWTSGRRLAYGTVVADGGKVLTKWSEIARFTRSLPGAPPASYVLIQNSVSFEKRPAGIETVTMVREEDGNWRLAGYFIR